MGVLIRILDAIFGTHYDSKNFEDYLHQKAATASEKLDWKNSIVDLMKLLGQDSSLAARKDLAYELGYPGPLDGSAAMNTWLHQKVMERARAYRS